MASASEWRRRVARWRASGESAREFAARGGWSPRTMSWWASRLRRDARDGVDFVELVGTVAPTSPPADAIEVVLSNERRVRVRAGFDAELLRAVVRTLESI